MIGEASSIDICQSLFGVKKNNIQQTNEASPNKWTSTPLKFVDMENTWKQLANIVWVQFKKTDKHLLNSGGGTAEQHVHVSSETVHALQRLQPNRSDSLSETHSDLWLFFLNLAPSTCTPWEILSPDLGLVPSEEKRSASEHLKKLIQDPTWTTWSYKLCDS